MARHPFRGKNYKTIASWSCAKCPKKGERQILGAALVQFAFVSILSCIDRANFGSNNFTTFHLQMSFKSPHCKWNNVPLMLRIFFIKIRNLALTFWYIKWCIRTFGCIFFICNHKIFFFWNKCIIMFLLIKPRQ